MPNEDVVTEQFTNGEVRREKSTGQLFIWNGTGWQSLYGAAVVWQDEDGNLCPPYDVPPMPDGARSIEL